MSAPNYRIYDCTGGGVTHDIYAESLEDAIEQGREWIEGGDWSGCSDDDDRTTYRTIELECVVREITMRSPRPSLDGTETSRVRDLLALDCAPESIRGVDYDDMDREQLETLAEYLSAQDDSVSDDDAEYDRSIAEQITDELAEEDEDVTDEQDAHDCSGEYSDPMPDCEASDAPSDEDQDGQGHVWVDVRDSARSHGGTTMSYRERCTHCGCQRLTTDPGSQRNPNEPLRTVTISPPGDEGKAWLKRRHDDNGYIPVWLAEYLGEESDTTQAGMEQTLRDLAADEAQDVSQGIYEDAIRLADEVAAGDLSRDDAAEALADLKTRLEEAKAEQSD